MEATTPQQGAASVLVLAMCTFAIFPRTKVGPVMGFCLDDAPEYADAPGFETTSAPGLPANGIYVMEAGGAVYDHEQEPEEIFRFEPQFEQCRTIDEVEQLLVRYRHFPKRRPRQVGFLDLDTGETLLAEQSWSDAAAWRPINGVAFNTSRGPETPRLRELCDQQHVQFKCHDIRMASMCQALASGAELDVDLMWRMFLRHEHDGAVCQHKDTRPQGIFPITLKMWVMAPALGKLWVRRYKGGRPPCQDDPLEIAFEPWPCKEAS